MIARSLPFTELGRTKNVYGLRVQTQLQLKTRSSARTNRANTNASSDELNSENQHNEYTIYCWDEAKNRDVARNIGEDLNSRKNLLSGKNNLGQVYWLTRVSIYFSQENKNKKPKLLLAQRK